MKNTAWKINQGQPNRDLAEIWNSKLVELTLFIIISICAYHFRGWNLFTAAPEEWRHVLGNPPEGIYVTVILMVYGFSAFILAAAALVMGKRPDMTWKHLGYRSAFYLFYAFSGSIAAFFPVVLTVAFALYAMELSHIWLCSSQQKQNRKPSLSGRF